MKRDTPSPRAGTIKTPTLRVGAKDDKDGSFVVISSESLYYVRVAGYDVQNFVEKARDISSRRTDARACGNADPVAITQTPQVSQTCEVYRLKARDHFLQVTPTPASAPTPTRSPRGGILSTSRAGGRTPGTCESM